MKNYVTCNIHVEKSSLALELEKTLGVSWSLQQESPFDAYFDLRACIIKNLIIEPGECIPVPTGIYPQLMTPNFILEVTSNHDLVYKQGISILDSPMVFSYTFRNEIWVLLKNNFKEAQTITPAKKVASLSIRQLPQTVIKYVDEIEKSSWSFKTSKKFIQEIKKKVAPEIYDIPKNKIHEFYSRDDIEQFKRNHNGS